MANAGKVVEGKEALHVVFLISNGVLVFDVFGLRSLFPRS